jgi:hypothetical protein
MANIGFEIFGFFFGMAIAIAFTSAYFLRPMNALVGQPVITTLLFVIAGLLCISGVLSRNYGNAFLALPVLLLGVVNTGL